MSYIPPHMLVAASEDSPFLSASALVNKDWNAIVQPKLDSLKAEFLHTVLQGLDVDAGVSTSGLAFLLKNAHNEAAFVPDRIFEDAQPAADSTADFLKNGLARLNVARTPAMWYAWACLYLTFLMREPGATSINEVLNIKYQAAKHHAKVPQHLWARLQSLACELIDDLC